MLDYESHELFLSLSSSHEIWKLRSSHTVISEVYGVAAVVDFTKIPSCIVGYSSLCFARGFSPSTGYLLSLAQSALFDMLTQLFCIYDAVDNVVNHGSRAELIGNAAYICLRQFPEGGL